MLKDGTYAAWFKTPLDQGTGIVHLADGEIWGRDSLMTYHGVCKIDGERFTATVSTKRHTDGRATIFGVDDELTLEIEGICAGKIATYTATTAKVPGVVLQGTLIRTEQPSPAPERTAQIPAFNPDKLPKLPTRSR
ncbi:hypothetical protein JQ554_25810 [Bradyrhizobium diazoefficiens]|jgi:hypothetical protein|nr:hypothetical protein [Bradyrhizobium diazoefficiens]UCF51772.1 MAG: hypothetical protein JSV48_20705 [Bradyrhizobium sp.]MBR0967560.1 hypothetical protein [Bradyrhizobium diazoefficiens]MBR0980954.1 hypothetical protein [Bradyrhizobium diazoefficiens]MBR1010431.1 hypothetical protein [Bradyrhizobium diazoefficiens]MBR1017087.1 hypothetical protein [Bradyrhizobium diazoefficiens]